jgi:CBS domain-containing protein
MPTRAAFIPAVRTKVLVREVMNSPVITADPTDTIKEVSNKMTEARVGSVVVIENGLPIGIVTDGDIVFKVVSKDSKPSSVKAVDVMSTPLHMIESEKEILEAARALRRLRIKRLGVSYKKKLVGIVSISDILAVTPDLFDIVSEKALIVTGEAEKQPTYLAGYCDNCNQWSDLLLEVDGKFTCEECLAGKRDEEASNPLEQP